MSRPEFDEKDKELLILREVKRHVRQSKSGQPEVGDFVLMPDSMGGGIRQFTHDWGDSIQTTVSAEIRKDGTIHPCAGDISFYIDRDGECNFSGSLDSALPKDKLKLVDGKRYGNVWFFHHDQPGAHRGVYARIAFNVWEYKP